MEGDLATVIGTSTRREGYKINWFVESLEERLGEEKTLGDSRGKLWFLVCCTSIKWSTTKSLITVEISDRVTKVVIVEGVARSRGGQKGVERMSTTAAQCSSGGNIGNKKENTDCTGRGSSNSSCN